MSLYEWGRNNNDDTYGFDEHRPGWGVPIHELLVKNNVTIFFHCHDHFFAEQELDNVTYEEVPQPATIRSKQSSPGTEYGYVNGVILGSPGHLRVAISPESMRVDYIGACLSNDTRCSEKNGKVVYSYTLNPD